MAYLESRAKEMGRCFRSGLDKANQKSSLKKNVELGERKEIMKNPKVGNIWT